MLKHIFIAAGALAIAAAGAAKLPAPTPEQQAAAALNAAKAAHAAKVDAYTLCMSQSKVAEAYIKEQKAAGKAYTPEATPACVNPGPFVRPTCSGGGEEVAIAHLCAKAPRGAPFCRSRVPRRQCDHRACTKVPDRPFSVHSGHRTASSGS